MRRLSEIRPPVIGGVTVDVIDLCIRPLSGFPQPRKPVSVVVPPNAILPFKINDRGGHSGLTKMQHSADLAGPRRELACIRIVVEAIAQLFSGQVATITRTSYLLRSHVYAPS